MVSRRLKVADAAARWLVLEVATEVAAGGEHTAAYAERKAATKRATTGPPSVSAADDDARLDFVLRSGNLALIDWDVGSDRIVGAASFRSFSGSTLLIGQ